jgi:cell division septation protein DedD
MRRLLATTAVMAVALIVMPHAAQASPDRFDLGFVDPYEFQESDPIGAYATMRDEGARVVRLPITWREVAANQPAHPTDPNDPAYNWALFDHRIDKIRGSSTSSSGTSRTSTSSWTTHLLATARW